MTQPGLWLDPLVLGDLKAGIETMADVDPSGELGVGLVWFASIPASQQQTLGTGALHGLELDGVDFGDWAFRADIGPALRAPDPAQAYVLRRDGHDILAVAQALDTAYGADPIAAARRVAMALMARAAHHTGHAAWHWHTPLGRQVRLQALRTAA